MDDQFRERHFKHLSLLPIRLRLKGDGHGVRGVLEERADQVVFHHGAGVHLHLFRHRLWRRHARIVLGRWALGLRAAGRLLGGPLLRGHRRGVEGFRDFSAQHVLGQAELAGRGLQVDRPLDGVRNGRDGGHHRPNHVRPFQRVGTCLVREQASLEFQEVLGVVVDGLVQGVAAHLLGVRVWVVAVRQQHHLHGHALGQQQIDAAERRPNARRIAVEDDRHVLGEAADELDLAWRQRRPARRHHVAHPGLVHGHDVSVAFDKEAALLLDDLRLGKVHAVEHLRLVVERAFWRVEVLRHLLFRAQGAATKSNDPARHIPNREHHPAFEEIPKRPVLALLAQPGLHEFLCGIPGFLSGRGQCVPGVGAVPDQKRVEHVVPEPAFHEIAASDGLASVGVPHLVGEPLLGPRHHVAEALLGRRRRDFLGRALLLHNLDVVTLGQHPEGFRVADLLDLHQKGDEASALLTREALENPLGGQDVKRRGFLVGERTQPPQGAPRFFQLHVIAHHLFDDGGVHDLVDGFCGNHGKRWANEDIQDFTDAHEKRHLSRGAVPCGRCLLPKPATNAAFGVVSPVNHEPLSLRL